MTLIEIIDTARNLVNEPLDTARSFPDNTSSFFKDSELTTYFNLLQQEVQQEVIQTYEDYFLTQSFLSITNGVSDYTLPTATIKVRRLEDVRGDGEPLEIFPVTLNDRGSRLLTLGSQSMRGGAYYLKGDTLALTDTPGFDSTAAYQLHYIKRVSNITAGTASSEIKSEHHGVLVWGLVKYMQHQQQANVEALNTAEAEYQRRMIKMVKHAESRQVQRPRKVKSVYRDTD